jgi:hypothetical protein
MEPAMTGPAGRCVVCGIAALVIVRMPDAVVAYCSTDWLAVSLDVLPPGTVIAWTHDTTATGDEPAAPCLPGSKARPFAVTESPKAS